MADWKAFEIKIPGKDLLEQVRQVLETLLVFLEIVKALLEAIKLFLIDLTNPIRPIVEAIMALITQLFESLKRTGLFGYFDIPNPLEDPSFDRFKGGYQAFTERFKASLFDSRDPFRPQPAPSINQSGFVLIVADAETVFGLLRLIKILLRFFGKELLSPMYTAPANVKVFAAGTKPGALGGQNIDPILQTAAVFGAELKGIAVEWSLATNQFPPDPGFQDLVANVGSEFIPQKWLIERSDEPQGPPTRTVEAETNFEDRRGQPIKRLEKVRDEYGDFFREFNKVFIIDPTQNAATFFLGQLGTFRYIDDTAEKGKVYHYRIRAFSGDLDASDGGSINLKDPEKDPKLNTYIQRYPSTTNDPVIVGRPSPIVQGRIPDIPPDFDVITNLRFTFQMAFALAFHLEKNPTATFDADGRPTGGTSAQDVGRGSLTNLGGALSQIIPALTLGFVQPEGDDLGAGTVGGASFDTPPTNSSVDPVTGSYPDVTHNYFSVKAHSARLAQYVGGALLENSAMLYPLRDLYQGTIPRPVPTQGNWSSGITTNEKMVYAFNDIPDDFPETFHPKVYETYIAAYNDVNARLNLLDIINFIKSFTLGGTKPDWVAISLFRDIIPWSGDFIYDLLNRIDALLDAFQSIIDEIKAFIDALIRKIEVMERFIKFLIEILNYLDSFSVGFYFLAVPNTDQGIPGWIQAIDNAGGSPPPSGPGGYTAGIALAYSGPNVDAFASAFGLIF